MHAYLGRLGLGLGLGIGTLAAGARAVGNWLLRGGAWRDEGVWDDTATWED